MKNKRMQLKKRNNPTCFEERNEDAIYKKGRRHWWSTTLLEQDLFYRLYVLVCVDSYSDKHTNPEDELWLSGQSANTVMVGGGFPLPPFSRWTSRLWHFQFHTVKAWERSDGSISFYTKFNLIICNLSQFLLLIICNQFLLLIICNLSQFLLLIICNQFLLLIICNLSQFLLLIICNQFLLLIICNLSHTLNSFICINGLLIIFVLMVY